MSTGKEPMLIFDGKPVDEKLFGICDILANDDERKDIDTDAIVEESVQRVLDILDGFTDEKKNIGIIINDGDRPTPSHLVIGELLKTIPSLIDAIGRVHIATGSHPPPSGTVMEEIVGRYFPGLKDRIHVHDGTDEDVHRHICRTKMGTDVYIDKNILDHDLLLIINSVEPHYFAGYTGGRKSLVPGMALNRTIEMNHSHALEKGSASLKLEGNPVHDDMVDAVSGLIDEMDHISVQMVQGPGKILTSIEVGELNDSFERAVSRAEREFTVNIDHDYDIVVSFARPPMDRTLYQAQKAIENGKMALKEGGVIILVASLSRGIGKETFWDLLTSQDSPGDVMERIKKGYRLGYHKAAKLADLSRKCEIFTVSRMNGDILKRGFLTPFYSLEEAIDVARKRSRKDPEILVIPDGTVTVPRKEEV